MLVWRNINRTVQLCSIVYAYVVAQFREQFNRSVDWVLFHSAHFIVLNPRPVKFSLKTIITKKCKRRN